jgi:RNA polymerase sigma-70 factor (ECF subfamily)
MTASSEPALGDTRSVGPGEGSACLERLARREAAALREVIAAHAERLHRIAWRMTGDAVEAEDIVQEALLRLWDQAAALAARHPAGSRAAASLRLGGWLQRVVTNLAIDRLRRVRRLSHEDVPEREDDAPRADAVLVADAQSARARALIAALPERQRAAIVLTYYEELPNAEAAAALEMNIKAFESLLHRARAALRQAFAGEEGDR